MTKQSSGETRRENAKLRGSPSRMPNYSRNQEDEDRENDNLYGMRTIGRRRRFPDFTSKTEQEPRKVAHSRPKTSPSRQWPGSEILRSLTMLNPWPERLPYREPFRRGFP
jgi:hypothetical protein